MDLTSIEKEALKLTEAERALLADRLLASLSRIPESRKAAWVRECQDRLDAYRNGNIEAVDGPDAIAKLKARFST